MHADFAAQITRNSIINPYIEENHSLHPLSLLALHQQAPPAALPSPLSLPVPAGRCSVHKQTAALGHTPSGRPGTRQAAVPAHVSGRHQHVLTTDRAQGPLMHRPPSGHN